MTAQTRRPRLLRALAASLTAAALLAGCALLPNPFAEEPGLALPEGLDEALVPYYQQTLEWRECRSSYECATLEAPLDWQDPARDSIELRLLRAPATGERIGSLLLNPGGPGGSGVDMAANAGAYGFGAELLAGYDLIGFDPRGVGGSTPITCFETTAAKDAHLLEDPINEPGTDAYIAEIRAAVEEYAAECGRLSGDVIGFVDTVSAARDMDLIRYALGEEQLDYLGFSYGTFLGAMYAELYPDQVGRMVLDGAVDPTADPYQSTLYQAQGFDSALRAYLADCANRAGCPFGPDIDASVAQIAALLDSLHSSPVTGADGRVMGESAGLYAVITPLYDQGYWQYLDLVITGLQQGDATMAFAMFDSYTGRDPFGEFTSNIIDANIAINCLDAVPGDDDPAVMRAEALRLEQVAPFMGRYMSYGAISCNAWPWKHRDAPEIRAEGAPPILVIGTTNDPATPYAEAVVLAEQLASGVLVTYEGEGHTAYGGSSACIDGIVHDFLLRGEVPKEPPTC